MKKLLLTLLLLATPLFASAQLTIPQGGTGTTTIPRNYVLVGSSTLRISAMATSSLGLPTFADLAGIFSTTSADYWKTQSNFFSTTSADYWQTQSNFYSTTSADYWKSVSNFFSTTSADYWKTQSNFFSTTSADYWSSLKNFFSTTSADAYINASSTIAHAGNASQGQVLMWDGSTWVAAATSSPWVVSGANIYYPSGLVAGNVGIGTSSPFAKLSIHANNNDALSRLFVVASSTLTGTTTLFNVDYRGFVGIGTGSQANSLSVVGSSATEAIVSVKNTDATAVASGIEFLDENGSLKATFGYNNSTNEAFNWAYAGIPLKFAAGGSERARILSTGEFGIATSSPYQELSVTGDIALTGGIYDPGASRGTSGDVLSSTGSAVDWVATSTLKINAVDLVCTDCIGTTEISDSYLLNNGDAGTGVFDFGGATSFELPNGTAPTVDTDGECAIDTTSGQLKCDLGTVYVMGNGKLYPAFTYATTTWTGTTTIPLGPAFVAETWNGVMCFTDAGTLRVQFSDGTNVMNSLSASTTVGTFTLSSNNTFTAAEKRYVNIGNPASSPTRISCTVSKSITAD